MGRTVPSYRMVLESEIDSWKPFRDALRIDEREAFDELMDLCRSRASAASVSIDPSQYSRIITHDTCIHASQDNSRIKGEMW